MAASWPKASIPVRLRRWSVQTRWAAHRRQVRDSVLCRRRDCARATGVRRCLNKTVQCGHTLSSFYFGKDPVYAFNSGVAFGANARQQASWLYYGGGLELMREIFAGGPAEFPLRQCRRPDGRLVSQGDQYGRDSLKGLRVRIGETAVWCCSVSAASRRKSRPVICTPRWGRDLTRPNRFGPHDDEKLGFAKVAPYYYTPGWWEGSAMITSLVTLQHGRSCRSSERLRRAEWAENLLMLAKYDQKNPAALKRLIAGGTKLRAFPAGDRGLLQGVRRDLQRALHKERGFQARL